MKYGRRDSNHSDVVGWYREMGCAVAVTADLGLGLPDAFVGCAGVTDPVEIKSADGELTPEQRTFIAGWRGSRVWIPRTLDDVTKHVADMRKRARTARWTSGSS